MGNGLYSLEELGVLTIGFLAGHYGVLGKGILFLGIGFTGCGLVMVWVGSLARNSGVGSCLPGFR